MLDLTDIHYPPNLLEISRYVDNALFDPFYQSIIDEHQALCKIEYSKDSWALGWNIKLRKAGRGLCVIYPRRNYFTVLVVIGQKEKEKAERLLPSLCGEIQEIYHKTKEGMGQRWLMIDLQSDRRVFQDVLRLIRLRREGR